LNFFVPIIIAGSNRTSKTHGNNYKYDASYEEIAESIKKEVAASIPALDDFYRRVILNYLIGNADAHLKNFSLMRKFAMDDYLLSPNYDLLYTRFHLREDDGYMALDLFRDYETETFGALGYYSLQDFEEFGINIAGIKKKRLVKIFQEIIQSEEKVYKLIEASYMSDKAKESFRKNYRNRLHNCLLYFIESYSFKNRSVLVKSLNIPEQ